MRSARSSSSKLASFKYKRRTRSALPSSGCTVAAFKRQRSVPSAFPWHETRNIDVQSCSQSAFPQFGCKTVSGYVQRSRARRAPAATARKSQLSSANVLSGKGVLASPAQKSRNFKMEKYANYASVSAARESQLLGSLAGILVCKSSTHSEWQLPLGIQAR